MYTIVNKYGGWLYFLVKDGFIFHQVLTTSENINSDQHERKSNWIFYYKL